MEAMETLSEYEIERGKPMPSLNHGVVQSFLIGALLRYKDKFTIASELSLNLPSRLATPDISVYPKRSIDLTHDELKVTEPPLLIIEIVSPTQSDYEIIQKFKDYFKDGVKSCWLVHLALGAITVFTPDLKSHIYSSGEVTDPVLDITISFDEIF